MSRIKVWKDALFEGTWVTTKGQVFNCAAADMKHFRDRTKAMLSHGAAIPWCFEHQHDDESTIGLSANDLLARWAKNTGGHIHDVRIAAHGPLQVLMDVDEKDKPKLESIKFVSPDIRRDWRDRNGPASDETGPYWPGQSIAHLAVTPIPVQYPQSPFNFEKAVSLSAAGVDVQLSAAKYTPAKKGQQDNAMPLPPKDDKKPDASPDETTDDEAPGEDLEGGGPVEDATGTGGDEAAAMAELEHDLADLGIEIHGSASDNMLSFLQHLSSCIKTHKATKAGGAGDEPDPNDPNQQDPNNQEPEQTEPAPIMMSAAPTPTEKKLLKLAAKSAVNGLQARINTLYASGYIDDKMKADWSKEAGSIQLSAGDVDDDGNIKPVAVTIKIEAFERLMKTGRPGSFARVKGATNGKIDPNKPISSALALSGAREEVVDPPYGDDDDRKAQESAGDELAALCMSK